MKINQNYLQKIIQGTIILTNTVNCQTNVTAIAGIGIGTFIIIIAILFSIIWCLACRSSSRPEVYSAIGLILPVILIVIFILMPKQADRVQTSVDTDVNFVIHVVFLIIAIIGFIVASILVCIDFLFTGKKAKNIARSAFVIRQQEEEALTVGRRSRVALSRSNSQVPMRPPSRQSGA